ncbi:DB module domain-containing protein [Ditylenchus destructor]|uniref:DB module domain-containing protein n=1 Tax=Ditylenchus destructor TaxID=166010 RepID=A0AAD4MT27_9BILA|nr:DB module domain-containing protein [Ditylenchus destructor]
MNIQRSFDSFGGFLCNAAIKYQMILRPPRSVIPNLAMTAPKLFVILLLVSVISADDPKDKLLRECCERKGVQKKYVDKYCNYSGHTTESCMMHFNPNEPIDDDLFADMPAMFECGTDGKDLTECCKKRGVVEACLGSCNGSLPIELSRFAPCQLESKEQHQILVDCYHDNAYN